MKRIIIVSLIALLAFSTQAQQKRNTSKQKATVTRSTATKRKSSAASSRNNAARKGAQKTKGRQTARNNGKNKKGTASYTNASIRGLQNQRSQVQKKIRQQEQALRANKADVKKRLQNLMVLNTEIGERQKKIDNIQSDISHIDNNIGILNAQLKTLEQQLNERKARYIKSMRYITRQHTFQDRLLFILSARGFAQMYRRLRFAREYAAYQRVQGEAVKAKQVQVDEKHRQLQQVKGHKTTLLAKGQEERKALEGQQTEQQNMVASLQKQQKTIQQIIDQQKKVNAKLNAEIDRQIARRKAEAEAARKRAAELARKKAQAEAEARENARRIAEAKAREQRLKEAARLAAQRENEAQRERAEQAAREAEAERLAAERKAEADAKRSKKAIAEVKENAHEALTVPSADRALSGAFEQNRGRLPMPITGSYRVVSHFGQYNVEGLKGVTLDNKGINILGSPGAQARSIYNGEVSAVFGFSGSMVVMVRHGSYISVYCNLSSVCVSRGQKVSTRQALGTVGRDHILQFQLRHNMAKLNPESWIGR